MNLKNCKYMASAEFKTRQLWLNFVDAVGIALNTISEGMTNAWTWFKNWKPKTMKDKHDNKTLELDFSTADAMPVKTKKYLIDLFELPRTMGGRWCVLARAEDEGWCIKIHNKPQRPNFDKKSPINESIPKYVAPQ